MKSISLFSALCLLVGTSLSFADTAMVPANEIIIIQGKMRPEAKMNVTVVYSPETGLGKALVPKECAFKEDEMKATGTDVIKTQKPVTKDGQYQYNFATKGQRGSCAYILNTVYFSFETKKVYETLSFKTRAVLDAESAPLKKEGIEVDPPTNLSELKGLICDFDSEYEVGTCDVASDDIGYIQLQYQIENSPATYTLDVNTK